MEIIGRARSEQISFVTEDDSLVEFIGDLVAQLSDATTPGGGIGPISTGSLYSNYMKEAPANGWPFYKSASAWGSRLVNMKPEIEKALKITIVESRGHAGKKLLTIHKNPVDRPYPSPGAPSLEVETVDGPMDGPILPTSPPTKRKGGKY